jgi:hypothetical protein
MTIKGIIFCWANTSIDHCFPPHIAGPIWAPGEFQSDVPLHSRYIAVYSRCAA